MLTAQDGEWCEASPSPAGQPRAGSSEVPRCTSCAPRPAAFLAHLVDELRRVGSLHIDRLALTLSLNCCCTFSTNSGEPSGILPSGLHKVRLCSSAVT